MFEFLGDYKDLSLSYERFYDRLPSFKKEKFGLLKHHVYWILHNIAVHPLLGAAPCHFTLKWHEITSGLLRNHFFSSEKDLINILEKHNFFNIELSKISSGNKKYWLLHNCIAHPLIGLFPIKLFFNFHDETAKKMKIDGWV